MEAIFIILLDMVTFIHQNDGYQAMRDIQSIHEGKDTACKRLYRWNLGPSDFFNITMIFPRYIRESSITLDDLNQDNPSPLLSGGFTISMKKD